MRIKLNELDRFGMLTFISEAGIRIYSGQKKRMIKCLCECGNEGVYQFGKLKSGETRSCGCLNKRPAINRKIYIEGDYIGIGLIFVKDIGYINKKRNIIVKCKFCNTEKQTTLYVAEHSKSCGCLNKTKRDLKISNKSRICSSNRRGKIKSSSDYTINIKSIDTILYLYNNCPVCLKDITNNYHIDHIIPLSKGGEHSIYNIQLLCPECNMNKSNK